MNKPIHPAVAEHVMEENEKLRGLLEELHPYVRGCSSELWDRYHAALSQQAEPAPAQDERELPLPDITTKHGYPAYSVELVSRLFATRPEQTEQQPCAKIEVRRDAEGRLSAKVCAFEASLLPVGQTVAVYAAPIAQTAPQPEQSGLVEAITPEIIDWVRCGLSVNGRLVDGSHPALDKLRAAYRAALSAQGESHE